MLYISFVKASPAKITVGTHLNSDTDSLKAEFGRYELFERFLENSSYFRENVEVNPKFSYEKFSIPTYDTPIMFLQKFQEWGADLEISLPAVRKVK